VKLCIGFFVLTFDDNSAEVFIDVVQHILYANLVCGQCLLQYLLHLFCHQS